MQLKCLMNIHLLVSTAKRKLVDHHVQIMFLKKPLMIILVI